MKKLVAVTIALMVALTGCKAALPSNNQKVSQQGEAKGTNESAVKKLFEKGYYDYQGNIGGSMDIQMSIYPLGADIVGSYFYEDQRKEITLKGKAEENNLELNAYDGKGQLAGTFAGKMTTVDKIEGMWRQSDSTNSYPFTLTLKSIMPGAEYGKRYAVAVGEVSDQEVEGFAEEIQGLIKNDGKQELSDKIKYPIKVKIEGKTVEIQNKTEFIKNYDRIFDSNYNKAMSNAFTKYMFANWQGVMLGEGYNMWINVTEPGNESSSLRIIAINN